MPKINKNINQACYDLNSESENTSTPFRESLSPEVEPLRQYIYDSKNMYSFTKVVINFLKNSERIISAKGL